MKTKTTKTTVKEQKPAPQRQESEFHSRLSNIFYENKNLFMFHVAAIIESELMENGKMKDDSFSRKVEGEQIAGTKINLLFTAKDGLITIQKF